MTASPPFQPFELEAFQSIWEQTVAINLADSGVQCLRINEWLSADDRDTLFSSDLFYPEVNGTAVLRSSIAALYREATPDQVLVTVGASQANALVAETLLSPGDEVVVVSPGYRQMWGLATNIGCKVIEMQLDEAQGWTLSPETIHAAIGPRTKLVSIVNPNNPTGMVLGEAERAAVVAACRAAGAWLHADEVYGGTDYSGTPTRSLWGDYDRVVCVNSLSKSYGLAGLRIGWVVAPQDIIEALWRRHEYLVIAAAAPSMAMAVMALRPDTRQRLLDRQRQFSQQGRALLDDWLATQPRLSARPAQATSLAFLRYDAPLASDAFADHIRRAADVLVAPGITMGAEHHVRMAIGYDTAKLTRALDGIDVAMRSL